MNRLILGARGPDYGLWISRPGKDAGSSDDSDMMVSPSRPLLQPYMQGRILYNSSNPAGVIIRHNLGYVPLVEVFGPSPMPVGKVTTSALDYSGQYYIDVTYFIFRSQLSPS